MNPETNRFEKLTELTENPGYEAQLAQRYEAKMAETLAKASPQLLRPDGSPVPETWSTYREGELVVVKGYTFRVAHIGESYLVLEPVAPEDALPATGGRLAGLKAKRG